MVHSRNLLKSKKIDGIEAIISVCDQQALLSVVPWYTFASSWSQNGYEMFVQRDNSRHFNASQISSYLWNKQVTKYQHRKLRLLQLGNSERNARKFQSRMKTVFSWHSCILTAGLQIYSIRKSWLYWQIFGINLFEINHCSLLFMFRNAPLSPISRVFYYSEGLESSACSKMLFHFNTAFLVFSRITERKHMSLAVFWFPLSIHR